MATKTLIDHYFYYFAIIPIRLTSAMWLNYPVTEQVITVFKLRQRMENLPSHAHTLQKALNLVISCCCLAEQGEEMYQNLKRTCGRAFVFLFKAIVTVLSCCHCRRHTCTCSSFLNSLVLYFMQCTCALKYCMYSFKQCLEPNVMNLLLYLK